MQGTTAADCFGQFGKGKLGSMMALAQQLLATSELWVYGGFIRDAVIRVDVHDSMDLDVCLPCTGGKRVADGLAVVSKLAQGLNLQFLRTKPAASNVTSAFFNVADVSSKFEVQVVLYSRQCSVHPAICLLLLYVLQLCPSCIAKWQPAQMSLTCSLLC